MDLELKDAVAIVTGASQGIGQAIAETLAAEGMRVVLVARRDTQLQRVASGLPTAQPGARRRSA
jgi:NADP-dependent 3-hydroxy acid dehydrogenase YdfG